MLDEEDIFQLTAGIADGLAGIRRLKNVVIGLSQFEHAAKLRDLEILLLNVSNQLCSFNYPIPNKDLSPRGKLYHNHIFNYCIAIRWQQVPAHFEAIFRERKMYLNQVAVLNESTSIRLKQLNNELTSRESHIYEFFNFIQYVTSAKGIKNCLDEEPRGNIVISCYTHSKYYEFAIGSFDNEMPFYKYEIPLADFVNAFPLHSNNGSYSDEVMKLATVFNDGEKSLIFSILVTDGLLAIEDFINIDKVEIDLSINYKFSS